MQALILAAGMGRRLGKITENKTKGMVEVSGKTLIERSLDILTSFDEISRVVIVIGFAGQGVKDRIGTVYNGIPVIYVENPDYDKTNNIYSLYLAHEELVRDDTLLLESDLIFDRSLLENLIASKDPNVVLLAPWETWMDGTVATISENREIIQFISKENFDYAHVADYYKTVNIYKFSKAFSESVYTPFLSAYCTAFGHNEYYENILGILAFIKKTHLKALVVEKEQKWYEIDDLNGLDIAETLFSERADAYLYRYGGFWRFPKLKDYCYLVNPYFPTPKMVNEFRLNFERLMTEYPSTSRIQRKLSADMFGCSEKLIAVGNGASEIITVLLSTLKYDRVGIPIPTFHEYVARASEEKCVFLKSKNPNFTYGADDLIALSKEVDLVVLVNPDNPTGNFIPKKELLRLTEALAAQNKRIVIDESFVDFSDAETSHSLIDNRILTDHPNLFVVKSIGKSYGVPGCRLGVLASGDTAALESVQAAMPVWNISSFGEFFLQIFPRFKAQYQRAIATIIEERERFTKELAAVEFLRPIPSAANFILCEVKGGVSCAKLSDAAIRDHILIKDCGSKLGFDNRCYVRITVRDEASNREFIEFIRKFDPTA